jgi:Rrf2 family protein
MISQTVEYALRAVVTMAQNNGKPCTAREISSITKVPGPYLSKLMHRLVRAGLAKSRRGLHGGFVLTKEPRDLSILEVIDAVEPFKRIHECPLEIKTHEAVLCPLHRRLDQAMEMVERLFRETKIVEILGEPGDISPLCKETCLTKIESLDASRESV